MSAWIVSRAHIDLLVQALCEGEHVTTVDPDEVGRTLWRENHRSVNYRYDERSRTPAYRYRRPARRVDPQGVLYAVACYQYQSCERPDWPTTLANRWTSDLREALQRQYELPEFGKYPWGFQEEDVHRAAPLEREPK